MKTPTERDGVWIDDMGACKVCDGEIPSGHDDNCDIFKLEQKIHDKEREVDHLRRGWQYAIGERDALQAEKTESEELLQALYDSLIHMQSCGGCAEDNWNCCEGGRDANAAIERFEKSRP